MVKCSPSENLPSSQHSFLKLLILDMFPASRNIPISPRGALWTLHLRSLCLLLLVFIIVRARIFAKQLDHSRPFLLAAREQRCSRV